MAETVLEKEPVTERRSRSAVLGEHFENGVNLMKKIGRTSNDAAEEWMDDNLQRIKRHPTETVIGSLLLGLMIGGTIGFLLRKK